MASGEAGETGMEGAGTGENGTEGEIILISSSHLEFYMLPFVLMGRLARKMFYCARAKLRKNTISIWKFYGISGNIWTGLGMNAEFPIQSLLGT